MSISFFKSFVRGIFRKAGYHIEKYPSTAFPSISVFDLSVQLLMATVGTELHFIQIGANDGRYGDPLRKYIVKYPWHGILIEPQPDIFVKLCANYAEAKNRLIFENIAIAGNRASILMYKAASTESARLDPEFSTSVASCNPGVVAAQLGVKSRNLEQFIVPCATLDEVIKKHGMTTIHILQVDTEGHDYDVLMTLNLANHFPWIIQFEHGHLAPREINAAVEYLKKHEYRILYGGHQCDTIAIHQRFLSSID